MAVLLYLNKMEVKNRPKNRRFSLFTPLVFVLAVSPSVTWSAPNPVRVEASEHLMAGLSSTAAVASQGVGSLRFVTKVRL